MRSLLIFVPSSRLFRGAPVHSGGSVGIVVCFVPQMGVQPSPPRVLPPLGLGSAEPAQPRASARGSAEPVQPPSPAGGSAEPLQLPSPAGGLAEPVQPPAASTLPPPTGTKAVGSSPSEPEEHEVPEPAVCPAQCQPATSLLEIPWVASSTACLCRPKTAPMSLMTQSASRIILFGLCFYQIQGRFVFGLLFFWNW